MSDDYISRKDVQIYAMTIIKELEELYNTGCLGIADLDWRVLMEKILSVDNLSPADVKPVVRGEWIDNGCVTECSNCGEPKRFPHWSFYPNCGADMREEANDER